MFNYLENPESMLNIIKFMTEKTNLALNAEAELKEFLWVVEEPIFARFVKNYNQLIYEKV